MEQQQTERQFLAQLLNGTGAQPMELAVTVNASLRDYQKRGVAWLAFLARYKLHGALCDGTNSALGGLFLED